jgi:hypothetical protein
MQPGSFVLIDSAREYLLRRGGSKYKGQFIELHTYPQLIKGGRWDLICECEKSDAPGSTAVWGPETKF